ncbi:MAG: hypothetical protein JO100_16150 [Pseudonocardia sp.]|nr:hypothetical protein [Pseudonocardia sp.]
MTKRAASGPTIVTQAMTCVTDGREHLVDEQAWLAGNRMGRYEALCEHEVLPQSLMSPPGPVCRGCSAESARGAAAIKALGESLTDRGWNHADEWTCNRRAVNAAIGLFVPEDVIGGCYRRILL